MEGDTGKIPGKRQLSINSTGSERTPEYKRQLTVSQNRFATLQNQESDSDSYNASSAEKENDTPQITTFFPINNKTNMDDPNSTMSTTPWLGFKEEILDSMKKLNTSIMLSMKTIADDLSKRFNDLVESNSFLEAAFNDAKTEASEAKQKVPALSAKILETRNNHRKTR